MTKAGKLEREFEIFKTEVEARLAALENKKPTAKSKDTDKSIVIEAKDDIVAKDAE